MQEQERDPYKNDRLNSSQKRHVREALRDAREFVDHVNDCRCIGSRICHGCFLSADIGTAIDFLDAAIRDHDFDPEATRKEREAEKAAGDPVRMTSCM